MRPRVPGTSTEDVSLLSSVSFKSLLFCLFLMLLPLLRFLGLWVVLEGDCASTSTSVAAPFRLILDQDSLGRDALITGSFALEKAETPCGADTATARIQPRAALLHAHGICSSVLPVPGRLRFRLVARFPAEHRYSISILLPSVFSPCVFGRSIYLWHARTETFYLSSSNRRDTGMLLGKVSRRCSGEIRPTASCFSQ